MNPSVVAPMPEEPAIAHRERIALFHGLDCDTALSRRLLNKLGVDSEEQEALSPLNRIAKAIGMSMTDYARQHSMLGVLRVAARQAHLALHGAIEGKSHSDRLGMSMPKTHAYICRRCVEEDLNFWRFSWYRRAHQLQGVDWCSSHRVPLFRINAERPWTRLPHHWVELDELISDGLEGAELSKYSFESRLIEISCTLLQRARPLDARQLTFLLAARGRELGLRTSVVGVKPTLSELLLRTAPRKWIECYWPEAIQQEPGSFLTPLDTTLCAPQQASTGFAYITAFATLWDSPSRIHQALQKIEDSAVCIQVDSSDNKTQKEKRRTDFWYGGIWDSYVKCQGRSGQLALELGLGRNHVRNKLDELGLPSLRTVPTAPTWRAYLRFEAGESLEASCAAENVDVSEVEKLMRVSCARVASAARQILNSSEESQTPKDSKSSLREEGSS